MNFAIVDSEIKMLLNFFSEENQTNRFTVQLAPSRNAVSVPNVQSYLTIFEKQLDKTH